MASFISALRALNDLKASGVVRDYAIGGAMGVVFWTEPMVTYDLDVFVFDGVAVQVIRPEHLAALYLEPSARTAKRRERAAALIESSVTDQALLREFTPTIQAECVRACRLIPSLRPHDRSQNCSTASIVASWHCVRRAPSSRSRPK